MRAAEWSDGCFSVLRESWLPPDAAVSPPLPDVEQSMLTTSGISILSESLPSVEGMDAAIPPLSYEEWMGHWHTLAAMAPAVARAELYRLGHISEPRRSAAKALSRAVRVAVLGARRAGKTSLIQALCSGSTSGGDPLFLEVPTTEVPETSWTYIQLPRRLEDREGDALVVHLIVTDIPESALPRSDGRSLQDVMATTKEPFCDLCILVFDCTDAQSWATAKDMEAQHLSKDIPRMFVATKVDRLTDVSVLEAARQYCKDSDLEAPLVTAVETLNRTHVLVHVARCAIEDEPGIEPLKSKPHEAEQRAARRRKRLWLGGIVVVVVGVGWLWSRRDGPGSWRWLRSWWGRPNKVRNSSS